MSPFDLFVVFLRDSALSVGGSSALPLLRHDFVGPGLVTDQQVVEALTIGRISTGPTGLYMVSLGYYALGWLGAALALLGCALPPLVIVPAAAFLRRQLLSTPFAGAVRGLALTTSGVVMTTTTFLLIPSPGTDSVSWWQLSLVALGFAAGIEGRRHPALVMAAGGIAGLLLGSRT